ncbi:class I SAM-dependent methyltransferase [Saccharothrix sp. Mg75]|uniref:class I SAM-dependent methyltransferase n=1 Tax=Saccharothrix sp. Mg75 TaxID=3445357 RepID=UPI003EEA559F
MASTGGPEAITAFMDTVSRFNGPAEDAVLDAEASDEFKDHSIWLYDVAAMIAARGEIWNWGMDDPVLAREIDEVLPGSLDFCTDGVSEQLYFRSLRVLPHALGDYAGKTVVEIGSGAGEGLNFLSRAAPGGRFLGVELSPLAVRRANALLSRGGELRYVQGDAEALPLGDGEADVVISVESSHNYPHPGRFLAEVARVLKPGGYFSYLDGYTEHRYDLLTTLKRDVPGFEWLSQDDISEQVRAGIRKRMRPDSHFRAHTVASRSTGRFGRHVHFHLQATTMGSTFIGQRPSAVVRALQKAGRVPTAWTLPVESYLHSVARRLPA